MPSLDDILHSRFGLPSFRKNQRECISDVIAGSDVLLVMPTGAGKSLCYQVPGIYLGGTTLVVSPLISLINDQVQGLQKKGLRAYGLHSGLSNKDFQEILQVYRDGSVDFLFVSPERLSSQNFMEELLERPPRLIAIDEAHCISQWGHDFRHKYRQLGEFIKPLRPAPVIAMTATATETVQKDIIERLGLKNVKCHVNGFRRSNISIEVEAAPIGQRNSIVGDILIKEPSLKPSIVYAPSRKGADALSAYLNKLGLKSATYHAGLKKNERADNQEKFQDGEIDIIVGTIAFGMGIDKSNVRSVIHVAMPSSIEAYYQEIGRAGRDGLCSLAILLADHTDRHKHEFFLDKSYPDINILEAGLKKLIKGTMRDEEDKIEKTGLSSGDVARLINLGAIKEDSEGRLFKNEKKNWQKAYLEQKQHKINQYQEMENLSFNKSRCRMLSLMAYFGDPDSKGEGCGICDSCTKASWISSFLNQGGEEIKGKDLDFCRQILRTVLSQSYSYSQKNLISQLTKKHRLDEFIVGKLLSALVHNGILGTEVKQFVNGEGKAIKYLAVVPVAGVREINKPIFYKNNVGRKKEGKKASSKSRSKESSEETKEETLPVDKAVLEKLKAWRAKAAKKGKVPPYVICHNDTLELLAAKKPKNLEALSKIKGMGEMRIEKYGEDILKIVK